MTKQSIPKLTRKNRRPAANSLAAALRWDKIAAAGAEGDQAAGDQAAQGAAGAAGDQAAEQAAAGAASAGTQTNPKKEQ
jgi:hypothetical protein